MAILGLLVSTLVIQEHPARASAETGAWSPGGSMTTPRYLHTATVLANGQVLVAGGAVSSRSSTEAAELFDPEGGSWTTTGSLSLPRKGHTATLLASGKVLVAGGAPGLANTAELYDPDTRRWTPTVPMAVPRSDHTATLLPNGKVLVAGGDLNFTPTPSAELYDPLTGTWTSTGLMLTRRVEHTAVLLDREPCGDLCGKVLVTGGESERSATSSSTYDVELSELYDPATGAWSATGSMMTGRSNHSSTYLSDGRVLVVGGTTGDTSSRRSTASVEIYVPVTKRWISAAHLDTSRFNHAASLLGDGQVLVSGGGNDNGDFNSATLYDPATNAWRAAASLGDVRYYHSSNLLDDGRVLVAGGVPTTGAAELFSFQPSLSVGSVAVPEGDAGIGAAVFAATLSKPAAATVTVGYTTVAGTADPDSDYTPQSGTLTFPRGVTSLDIRVPVVGDAQVEEDETFTVKLSGATGAAVRDAIGVGTIINDDPGGKRRLAIGDVAIHEGDAGVRSATFTARLSGAKGASSVIVAFATEEGTARASDFTPRTGTLTFPPGSDSIEVVVEIAPDAMPEGDETFGVRLSRARGAVIADDLGTGTILDDDYR